MNARFLLWWRDHAPKGTANSANALLVVSLLRRAPDGLGMAELASIMNVAVASLRSILYPLVDAGWIAEHKRHKETVNRQCYHAYTLAGELLEKLPLKTEAKGELQA